MRGRLKIALTQHQAESEHCGICKSEDTILLDKALTGVDLGETIALCLTCGAVYFESTGWLEPEGERP